jgi:hypothetical protein
MEVRLEGNNVHTVVANVDPSDLSFCFTDLCSVKFMWNIHIYLGVSISATVQTVWKIASNKILYIIQPLFAEIIFPEKFFLQQQSQYSRRMWGFLYERRTENFLVSDQRDAQFFTMFLTFVEPCIANAFLSTTNETQRYTMFFIVVSALHVSSGFSAHHQELKEFRLNQASSNNTQVWQVPGTACTVFELLMMSGRIARNL